MILKNISKNFINNLILIISFFLLDRITKIYVIKLSEKNLGGDLFLSKFLNISLIWNEGIAFGLFSFDKNYLYNFISLLIFALILLVLFLSAKSEGIKKWSYLLIFSGGLGNLTDRIYYKGVPDFIDFHYQNFHWFVFNVADIFISIGIIYLLIDEIFLKNKNKNENI